MYSDDDEYPYADKPKQLIYSRNYVKSESSVVSSNVDEGQSSKASENKPDVHMFMFQVRPVKSNEFETTSDSEAAQVFLNQLSNSREMRGLPFRKRNYSTRDGAFQPNCWSTELLISNPHMIYILEKFRFVSPISPKIVPLLI